MKIFIAGASGGIGRQATEQALQAGHQVTALVRDPSKLPIIHPNLGIVTGDILRPLTFAHHLQEQQVVISALGISGAGLFNDRPTELYSTGCANLLAAMEEHGVGKIFCISASAIEISPVLPRYVRFAAKYILQNLLKHMYADLREMETIVKASISEWTIIRPPQLTNGPLTGQYRTAVNVYLKNGLKIPGQMSPI
jgi:putative NADH-flavin reductase